MGVAAATAAKRASSCRLKCTPLAWLSCRWPVASRRLKISVCYSTLIQPFRIWGHPVGIDVLCRRWHCVSSVDGRRPIPVELAGIVADRLAGDVTGGFARGAGHSGLVTCPDARLTLAATEIGFVSWTFSIALRDERGYLPDHAGILSSISRKT